MKRFSMMCVLFCICFIAALQGPAQANAASFTDVKKDAYYYEPVHLLYERGVISGKGNGKFAPNDYVTRGQAAKMIANALQLEAYEEGATFRDVPKTHSFYPYIAVLVEYGILSGYDDGTFKPNANVTRNQMAKMIARAYLLHTNEAKQQQLPYKDVSPSSSFYEDIQALNYYGVASSQNKYNGGDYVKRGQIAAFIVRAEAIEINVTGKVIETAYDRIMTTTIGILNFDDYQIPVTIRKHHYDQLYNIVYSNRFITQFTAVEADEQEVPDEEQEIQDENQEVPDEEQQVEEITDTVSFHSSDIGLFEIYSVKAKSSDATIEVVDYRNDVIFTAPEMYEGLHETFTISGETYLNNHRVEIDVDVFYENGRLQYDFNFEPSSYTLTAKDFISEKITHVDVLNETPINMMFKNGEITLTTKEVSAIPIQLRVTTEQNGKSVTFNRSVVALANGQLMENLYGPIEFLGLHETQYVIDVEGTDVTELADFIYVHDDFEGAKIPVIYDEKELAKYGRYSDVGLPSEVDQHVIVLLPQYKGIIYDQVRETDYHIDEVPIPADFTEIIAIQKHEMEKGNYYIGKTASHLQFGRNFFEDFYKLSSAHFTLTGFNANGDYVKKKYRLYYYGDLVRFEEVEAAEITLVDEIQRAIYEADAQKLSELLAKMSSYNYESINEWQLTNENDRFTFSNYLIDKYKGHIFSKDFYEMLELDSQIGHANNLLTALLEDPYVMTYNFTFSQLKGRINLTDEMLPIATRYNELLQKIDVTGPFKITGGDANTLAISPTLNEFYTNRPITIEQNGRIMKAQASLDYPLAVYLQLTDGKLQSGPTKVTITASNGKPVIVQQDVIISPTVENVEITTGNEVHFTYTDKVEMSDNVALSLYVDDDFEDITIQKARMDGDFDVYVTLSASAIEKLKRSEQQIISGLLHHHNGEVVEAY